jgi:hypothetical protein
MQYPPDTLSIYVCNWTVALDYHTSSGDLGALTSSLNGCLDAKINVSHSTAHIMSSSLFSHSGGMRDVCMMCWTDDDSRLGPVSVRYECLDNIMI